MFVPLVMNTVLGAVVQFHRGAFTHRDAKERLLVGTDAKLDQVWVCDHRHVAPVGPRRPKPSIVVGGDLKPRGKAREKAPNDAIGIDLKLSPDREKLLGPRLRRWTVQE